MKIVFYFLIVLLMSTIGHAQSNDWGTWSQIPCCNISMSVKATGKTIQPYNSSLRYIFYVRFRNDNAKQIYFDFGTNPHYPNQSCSPGYAIYRETLEPGEVKEISFELFSLVPHNIQICFNHVRLSETDEGDYICGSGN